MIVRFGKYFLVAFLGLIVDFGMLIFSKEVLNLHYLVAAAIGFLSGLVVNYLLSSKYVFANPKINSARINFVLFGVIGLVGLAILNVSMWALVSLASVNYVVAKVIATVGVYLWNFFARNALYRN